MRTNRKFLLAICWLLVGCQTATPPPTPPPTTTPPSRPTVTITVQPSPSATVTAAPSATPAPSATAGGQAQLSETGPYFMTLYGQPGAQSFVLFNQDGSGETRIPLPEGYSPNDFGRSLSPDARYVVMYAGTAEGDCRPCSLKLGLFDFQTWTLAQEIQLLGRDYPDNLEAIPADREGGQDPRGVFEAHITSFDWSPNGRYLAFAAQIDGPSSDLYVLDVKTGQRRRLTDGDQQIEWIDWARDGRHILHASTNDWAMMGAVSHFYVADVQTDAVFALGSASAAEYHWRDGTHVLANSRQNGVYSQADAWLGDITTGVTQTVWSGPYEHLYVDLAADNATVRGCTPRSADQAEPDCGVFKVDLQTGAVTKLPPVTDEAWGGEENVGPVFRTLHWDRDQNKIGFLEDEIRVVDATDHIVATLTFAELDLFSLRAFALTPDHKHFFAIQDGALIVFDLTTKTRRIVARNFQPPNGQWAYVWLETAP